MKRESVEWKLPNKPDGSNDEVKYWLKKKMTKWNEQEKVLLNLFKARPKNDNLEDILIKVACLNQFYSTGIFDVYSVAIHIKNLNIDKRLSDGELDFKLIEDIGKVTIKGKQKYFYSFATKYCFRHNAEKYPIYDSYVLKMLWHFKKEEKKKENSHSEKQLIDFSQNDLRNNYKTFVNVLNSFKEKFNLEGYSNTDIDKYLWRAGKHYFPNNYNNKKSKQEIKK